MHPKEPAGEVLLAPLAPHRHTPQPLQALPQPQPHRRTRTRTRARARFAAVAERAACMHVLHTWALHTLQSVQHAYMHMHNMLHALQSMLQLGERLEAADARADGLQRAQKQQARRELCDAVWAENRFDVSVALRGTDFMALGGLRLPRAPTPGQRDGNGLCPGLAVLRHIGDPAMQGPWLAAGGSLLWDPSKEERQVASLRVGLIAQPAPGEG